MLKLKVCKKLYANTKPNKLGIATLISDQTDMKAKIITRVTERENDKGLISREIFTKILNLGIFCNKAFIKLK